ncbi:MAG: hypothetical protein WAW46_01975 [Polaromonas sp.]
MLKPADTILIMSDAPRSDGMIRNASPSAVARNPNSLSELSVRFGRLGRLGLAMFFSPCAIATLKHGLSWHLIHMKNA